MAAGSGIRIGDVEREAAATSLREHYARGRLTLEEFQQRLDAVFVAKTDVELAQISHDLPHADPYAPPWPSAQPISTPKPGFALPAGGGQRYQWRRGAPASFGWVSMALFVLAIFLIAAVSWPLSFLPTTLLIVFAIVTFARRLLRRTIRGRRRW